MCLVLEKYIEITKCLKKYFIDNQIREVSCIYSFIFPCNSMMTI